ncbi:hypothetical protein EVAR_64191_1 [Eumeta japonica]|uniref:Uncharacterized protein n=1 Tax=Eumeta variegata TaxID=151549 RepID=A0A4C1ZIN7_EUMVA|nr:hypothetical protein EVAR_64191_1 [Eumeta japonica]
MLESAPKLIKVSRERGLARGGSPPAGRSSASAGRVHRRPCPLLNALNAGGVYSPRESDTPRAPGVQTAYNGFFPSFPFLLPPPPLHGEKYKKNASPVRMIVMEKYVMYEKDLVTILNSGEAQREDYMICSGNRKVVFNALSLRPNVHAYQTASLCSNKTFYK